ncbi:hypothetical protein SAMN05216268_1332 [Streptomyces yunnanensis]|uniref:Uncharacterized protein n=1 Tax=Streptomyces yunnanensis TaxID=156453 RepID=A0A9X8N8Y7_9ACTN|nr:hypothetical protein SAMN05216268_1332 [Streptomyces yunnanensis]
MAFSVFRASSDGGVFLLQPGRHLVLLLAVETPVWALRGKAVPAQPLAHTLLGHGDTGAPPDQLANQLAGPHRSADQQLLGRVVGQRLEHHRTVLDPDQLARPRAGLDRRREGLSARGLVLAPPCTHGPLRDPEHLGRPPVRPHLPRLQRGHHPQPHHLLRSRPQAPRTPKLHHTPPTNKATRQLRLNSRGRCVATVDGGGRTCVRPDRGCVGGGLSGRLRKPAECCGCGGRRFRGRTSP